jgi:phosphoglycolate phosphatase-like HAD superfamily hydrolase
MTLQIERIQALCFDIDGTLSDTDDVYVSKIARWLRPGRIILPNRTNINLPGAWSWALKRRGISCTASRIAWVWIARWVGGKTTFWSAIGGELNVGSS